MSENRDKTLSLLGLARRAGCLEIGGEAVNAAVRHGRAMLVLTASDASEGTKRRARGCAAGGGAEYIELERTKFELGAAIGRGETATVAVCGAGMADGIRKSAARDGRTVPDGNEGELI
ncbi:MAG: hypothetical protein LBS90_06800 [Oscillospiraceae bacterium]|jgi:ribosomal protein L7Ae-like RNA K-turn-binding protein|nr:hypothetical protein [Oscillospiraceae bacterium]